MWGGSLSDAWARASERASTAVESARGSLETVTAANAEQALRRGLADAHSSLSEAAASAADSAGVLARQTKLKGEIKLLESNARAWKQEWGAESFDNYFAGDLVAVSVSLYRCKAEIDNITAMVEAKRCQVHGLTEFGLAYDDVLHGALRRWRVRVGASCVVRTRHAEILANGLAVLPLRCVVRTWRRLLAHAHPSPHRRQHGDGVVDMSEEGGLMVPD